ncbi:hydrogenase expression protein HypE [Rhizobium rhizogenes]|uniref:hydrogenase large subunit n=1 Tax=Rhizobium rhizogenes TaxID=359 RepID=UPI0015741AA6|nr:hydrogenase expression protein HypE [Rhizobium rhizogenes]NTI26675.1 hydrogenase expression protein HypE [Rhizobium rhizogenes]NTI75889.1 hydrogenase expression protein HypE [Rhizobium rhizogenes]QTG09998.1 hydrogenase expression protein HypE [Rhizobium rhizogenes]
MSMLSDMIEKGRPVPHHGPWPRAIVDLVVWISAAQALSQGHLILLGLWGEKTAVHMAMLDELAGTIGVLSLENLKGGGYPSIAQLHPPALRPERALRDLTGLEPLGLPDSRLWLDHGQWGLRYPLGERRGSSLETAPYTFLRAEGDGLHQIPVGPVHAGIIEPGHFRFTANGETVVRLEERLGYAHKGIEALMVDADLIRGAQLAGRTSGDSTVAYAYAFSQAVEAALGFIVPYRAVWLRALMAELERLANHLGDIGAICNDAAFPLMLAHCGVLREQVLRAANVAFGHRLMRDRIVPGGVTTDLNGDGAACLRSLLAEIRRRFPALVELYDNTASLQDRTVGTGKLRVDLAREYGAGGYIGRASGRGFDARQALRYPPYDSLVFDVPVLNDGDVNARVWIRIREVEQSLLLIEDILDCLPEGAILDVISLVGESREGMALVEGFRGDVLVWLRLTPDGMIERCHLRDPSWFQWPLLEAAIEGNIVADFPLCNKSFNCSYSGHDL